MAIGDKKPVVMESDRAVPGGVATLGEDGKLEKGQRPNYTISQVEGLAEGLSGLGQGLSSLDDEVAVLQTGKQDKLIGAPGQLIGIDDDGAAQATVYPCNLNLLDNWYFINPVNQRGENEYTKGGYSIDRWYVNPASSGSKATITYEGIRCERMYFAQKYESYIADYVKTMTLSAIADGKLYTVTFIPSLYKGKESGLPRVNTHFGALFYYCGVNSNNLPQITFEISNSALLQAAKLELGPVQTLAHKEGDTWVLNDPPPNYALELAKCQRYYWRPSSDFILTGSNVMYSWLVMNQPFPVEMCARPTVTVLSEPDGEISRVKNQLTGEPIPNLEVFEHNLSVSTQGIGAIRWEGAIPENFFGSVSIIADANL